MNDESRARHWLEGLTATEAHLGGQSRSGLRQRQARALAQYETSFSVSGAASAAGVSRQTLHTWRQEDPIFAAQWRDAEEAVRDGAVAELYRRAVDGIEVVVRNRYGQVVGTEKKPSDRLLIQLVRGLDARFRDSPLPAPAPKDTSWREPMHRILADPAARADLERLADRLDQERGRALPPAT